MVVLWRMNECLWNMKFSSNSLQWSLSNHTTCRASDKYALHCSASAVFILWMYRGVYTDSLSPLISQLNAHGYSRATGCYRVHAEQNKQYQNCTLRIVSAQQHLACWKTQKEVLFLLWYLSNWSWMSILMATIISQLNECHYMCSVYLPSSGSVCCEYVFFCLFILFSLFSGGRSFCILWSTDQLTIKLRLLYTVIGFSLIFCGHPILFVLSSGIVGITVHSNYNTLVFVVAQEAKRFIIN